MGQVGKVVESLYAKVSQYSFLVTQDVFGSRLVI